MARKQELRTNIIVGVFVLVMLVLGAVSLFLIGQSEGTWEPKTTLTTDFKTITGLRKGSQVQLAGVEIGTVQSIDFIDVSYRCDPGSEDFGRHGQGRTDNCDPFLWCAPEGLCAELEPWASKELHYPCISNEDCKEAEICVTKDFRRRYPRVYWSGWDGVCARYFTEHKRVRITMEIYRNSLPLIRTDSRATVASNGVLGDQLVNITQGRRDPIGPGERIQSTPSLYEEIDLWRGRIDDIGGKVESSLSGISNLFSELNDERTISNIKGIMANINEATRQVADGEGLVGALFSDPQYKADFGATLRHVRDTADGVDRLVRTANGTLAKADESFQPLVEDARATMAHLRTLLDDLKHPDNKSMLAKLVHDPEGRIVKDFEDALTNVNKIIARIEDGEGTLGKLVNDSKAHDDLVKLMGNLERNRTLKRLTRYIMQLDDKMDAAPPQ